MASAADLPRSSAMTICAGVQCSHEDDRASDQRNRTSCSNVRDTPNPGTALASPPDGSRCIATMTRVTSENASRRDEDSKPRRCRSVASVTEAHRVGSTANRLDQVRLLRRPASMHYVRPRPRLAQTPPRLLVRLPVNGHSVNRVVKPRHGIAGGDWRVNDPRDHSGDEEDVFQPVIGDPATVTRGYENITGEPEGGTTSEHQPHESVGAPATDPRRLMVSRLAPMTRLPKMLELWSFLDRIECIAIHDVIINDDDEGRTVQYVLDVYNYQEQHSIPTHGHRSAGHPRNLVRTQSPLREPDFQVQHRFSSFVKLRSRLLSSSRRKHPRLPHPSDGARPPSSSHRHCAYCQRISGFLTGGSELTAPLDWKARLFTTVETRKALLSQFITELVGLVQERHSTCSILSMLTTLYHPPNHHVNKSVPGILRRFLTVQTGENWRH